MKTQWAHTWERVEGVGGGRAACTLEKRGKARSGENGKEECGSKIMTSGCVRNGKHFENDQMHYSLSELCRHTQKNEIRVFLSGVEPNTFRSLV